MKPFRLITIVGLIVIAGTASDSARSAQPIQGLSRPHPVQGCVGNPSKFAKTKIKLLHGNFVFTANGYDNNSHYKGPNESTKPVDPNMSKDLETAFSLAPPYLQTYLCNEINAVYLDPNGQNPDAWGFWEVSDPGDNTDDQDRGVGKWIALSTGLWTRPPASQTLTGYENSITRGLLGLDSSATYPAYKVDSQHDTKYYALLAILAHETGHILWHDKCENGCVGIHQYGWVDIGSKPRIHEKGVAFSGAQLKDDTISLQSAKGALKTLEAIYGFGVQDVIWPSLFSIVAPDEDFVETFELVVLIDAGVTLLQVQFTQTDSVNIIASSIRTPTPPPNIARAPLSSKLQFIRELLPLSTSQ